METGTDAPAKTQWNTTPQALGRSAGLAYDTDKLAGDAAGYRKLACTVKSAEQPRSCARTAECWGALLLIYFHDSSLHICTSQRNCQQPEDQQPRRVSNSETLANPDHDYCPACFMHRLGIALPAACIEYVFGARAYA